MTISAAINSYVDSVRLARSEHTARTYSNALRSFKTVLSERWADPDTTKVQDLTESALGWLAAHLKRFSPATERLYLNAVIGFYGYISAEDLAEISMPRLRQLIKQRSRRPGVRLPQFPVRDIESLLKYMSRLRADAPGPPEVRLRAVRDRAFLLTLADTGLRVHEACQLRRGDLDWNEGRAVVIGKGDRQAVVRFSRRAMRALQDYLSLRATLDGQSGRPLPTLPLFARHDKGAGKRIKSITTTTGRNIVAARVKEALGDGAEGKITPHSLRHYFVTTVLRGSGNLKLAQELARHKNIQVTQRYAHLTDDELDRGYHEIFERD
jgi:site-specific recombinase XerD